MTSRQQDSVEGNRARSRPNLSSHCLIVSLPNVFYAASSASLSPTPPLEIRSMSSSLKPKWWPISWISTWRTTSVEVLAGLAPVIEDRPAVEEDHVGARRVGEDALVRQRDAAIEAENVERAVEPHLLLGLLVGEFLDPDDDAAEMRASAPPEWWRARARPAPRYRRGSAAGRRTRVSSPPWPVYFGAMRSAPSRRIVSPLIIGVVDDVRARGAAYSSGLPRRCGNGTLARGSPAPLAAGPAAAASRRGRARSR